MKVMLFGAGGQVGRLIAAQSDAADSLVSLARRDVDIADAGAVRAAVDRVRPDCLINVAAYTAVDAAEMDADEAFRINADAAGEVARGAHDAGAPVIHLSTDYVFSGDNNAPYVETDAPEPLGVYGRSKLAGEAAVAAANPDHAILRTAWVYGPFGRNFVKTMLALAETREELRVVADQIGTPTSSLDTADALLAMISHWQMHKALPAGTYHFAGTGSTSWCGLAEETFRLSAERGGPSARVVPITTAEYPTKAMRPKNSRLNSTKFMATFGYTAPAWQSSLASVVARLVSGGG